MRCCGYSYTQISGACILKKILTGIIIADNGFLLIVVDDDLCIAEVGKTEGL